MAAIRGCDERMETFSYKMKMLWGSNIQHGDYS